MAGKKEKRFVKVYSDGGGFSGPATCVLVDRQTGINYLYVSGSYGGGVTPLLNRDGSPVVTSLPKEYDE